MLLINMYINYTLIDTLINTLIELALFEASEMSP